MLKFYICTWKTLGADSKHICGAILSDLILFYKGTSTIFVSPSLLIPFVS